MLARLINKGHRNNTEHAVTNIPAKTTATGTASRTRSLSSRRTHTHNTLSKTQKPKKTKTKTKTMAILSRTPTTNNYERLEGGMGSPSHGHPKKWVWTWRKFAIGAGVLIGLVWFVGPRAGHGEQWGLPVKGGDYR